MENAEKRPMERTKPSFLLGKRPLSCAAGSPSNRPESCTESTRATAREEAVAAPEKARLGGVRQAIVCERQRYHAAAVVRMNDVLGDQQLVSLPFMGGDRASLQAMSVENKLLCENEE